MGVGDPELDAMGPRRHPGPVVRFGAIGEAWSLVAARWDVWILTAIVVIAGNWLVGGLVFALFRTGRPGGAGGFRVGFPDGPAALQIVLGAIVNGFFVGGMFRLACRQVRGEPIRAGDVFSIVDVLGELLFASVLYAAALFVASLFCFIPALIVHGLLMFTLPLVVDGRRKATDAIAQSFHALKGEWLAATGFHLVVSLLSGIGTCLCCVGLLLTAPLYVVSIALLYRHAFLTKGPGFAVKPAMPQGDF